MTKTAYPKAGARTEDAQYAEFFDSIIGSGVRDVGALKVTADSTGLVVKVAAGFGVASGTVFNSTAVEALSIGTNSNANPRIDTIVVRRDFSAAGLPADLVVKVGTPSANSAAPTLTQIVGGVWEEPLADVVVTSGAAAITSANVTDRRRLLGTNVQTWTSGTRPAGRLGLLGLNTTTGAWEFHNGTAWGPLSPSTFTAAMISDPQNLNVGNAAKVGGRTIFVQAATPTGAVDGDLWFW